MKHKHQDISPREQRLIGNFIQAVLHAQLLVAPHGDFQNSVCFHDYLQHLKQNVRQMAYELINGNTIGEIQAYYGWHPNYIRYIYQDLQTEIQEYLDI